jgi:hypothetical protein
VSRLKLAIGQITRARRYTIRLLDHTDPADWFRQPSDITHIAWQVGHLAVAEYRLALERIRGHFPRDELLLPRSLKACFVRESVPSPEPADYPSPAELRTLLDNVHEQVLRELPDLADETLDEPPTMPHPLFSTKLGSLLWCGQHEMLHAGQIGLLRRLLGKKPLW